MTHIPMVLSWGGGVNSTAILCGMKELSMPWPDLILFADTEAEHPETYDSLAEVRGWLAANGGPPIVAVKYRSKTYRNLEEQCNVTGMLPSPAYGGHSCSIRWKQDAMAGFMKTWQPAIDTWAAANRVWKLIGYDRGERKRKGAAIREDDRYTYSFPLVEWGWHRGHCVEAIERAGLTVPVKSSCFFCPSKTKKEVFTLYRDHPDLYARALEMEENARARQDLEGRTDGAKGLGRRWNWHELIHGKPGQLRLFDDPPPLPCMCWDGDDPPEEEACVMENP